MIAGVLAVILFRSSRETLSGGDSIACLPISRGRPFFPASFAVFLFVPCFAWSDDVYSAASILAQGRELYAAKGVDCHGKAGEGSAASSDELEGDK